MELVHIFGVSGTIFVTDPTGKLLRKPICYADLGYNGRNVIIYDHKQVTLDPLKVPYADVRKENGDPIDPQTREGVLKYFAGLRV